MKTSIILSIIVSIGLVIIISGSYNLYILDTKNFSEPVTIVEQQKQVLEIDATNPVKVGVLHSLSGTMSISEKPVAEATLLAIEEINENGGVLGREIKPILVDGRSDWDTFEKEAERLIVEEQVSAIFGGWTSASRKTMLHVFEEHDHLLFYPVQYEGLETSPNIIYTGAAPNQQVLPAVDWAFENIGTKFFLVGSDYVFPRSANMIIKERVTELGGEILGEEYEILGSQNFKAIVKKIKETQPDIILNTINGDSNIYFFKELRSNGIYSEKIPTISFSIGENEIQQLGTKEVVGDYAAWNYFQSLDTSTNKKFVKNFQEKYGSHRVTGDPIEAGYVGVHIFAKAVEIAQSDKPNKIRQAVLGITMDAPEGIIGVDPNTQHLLKIVRIGQIQEDGQFQIVASSETPVFPEPYPKYKSKEQWASFLSELYHGWNENWSNPGELVTS